MSNAIIKFSENTKTSCYIIAAGLFVIAATTISGNITNKFISSTIRLFGIIFLAIALAKLVHNTQLLYIDANDITTNKEKMSIIAACSGLCLIILMIIIYGSYTLLF